MNPAHLHLMLNHVPVIGVAFGLVIAAIGLFARSKGVERIGLGLLVFSAMVAVPVYFTGDSAEEIVEGLPGVSEGVVDTHQSAAAVSLALACISGGLAGITLFFWRSLTDKLPSFLVAGTLVVTALTMASMLRTANLGGQIRHTEIRSTTGGPTVDGGAPDRKKTRDDDDD